MPVSPFRGELAVHVSGRQDAGAPTLVLLHGLSDSGDCWPDALARWSDAYRIVAWDARGHGQSPRFRPEQLEHGVGETHLSDLVMMLEQIAEHDATRTVLVGHSMGGGTAAALAGLRPDLVRAIVLEDPALGLESPDDAGKSARDRGPDRARQRVADALDTLLDPAAALATGRVDNPTWPVSEFEPWLAAKLDVDLGMLGDGAVTVQRPRLEVAAGIAVPALLMTGDHDVIWMPAMLDALVGVHNPHIEVGVVTGARHCVRRDVPDGFHAVVDPWIASQFGDPDQGKGPT